VLGYGCYVDATFLRILGMPEFQIDNFIDRLYRILVTELEKLQAVMGSGQKPEE